MSLSTATEFSVVQTFGALARYYDGRSFSFVETFLMAKKIDQYGNGNGRLSLNETHQFAKDHPQYRFDPDAAGVYLSEVDQYAREHPEARDKAAFERVLKGVGDAYFCEDRDRRSWGDKIVSWFGGLFFGSMAPQARRIDCP